MMRRLVTLFALFVAAAPAAAQDAVPTVPTIVTSGEATIRRAPDQAFITVSVETRARAPRDAQRMNAEAMTAVQQKAVEAGVPRESIRTTGYSIQQEFDFNNGRRIPREYLAHNGLEIRLDAVERTGDILDVLVAGGATTVAGVRFDLKDRAAVERDALRHAVEDARARADALAAGAGRTVDRVLRIEDSRVPRFPGPQPVMMRAVAADAGAATPVEPGFVEIHAQVTLTASIK